MDLSAVIFVAVAVAWAVYLVPKALRHHDEATRTRSVDRFSQTVRVLARREVVSARDARLVVPARERAVVAEAPQAAASATAPPEAPAPPTAAQIRARRMAARRATGRRRRVLLAVLAVNAVVAALAIAGVVPVVAMAAPAGLLAAWLLACRVMVRGEHAAWDALTAPAPADPPQAEVEAPEGEDADEADDLPSDYDVEANDQGFDEVAPAADTTGLDATPAAKPLWDPVPVTLPTYVQKAAAVRRSVRTIDLDATGVWTSGRTDEDARIAQATAKRVARESGGDAGQAVGS